MLQLLRILGLILILAGPVNFYATQQGNRQNIAVLEMMESRPRRDKTDSVNYASAVYHGTPARASEATKWRPTGYASISLLVTAVGLAMLLAGTVRRRSATTA